MITIFIENVDTAYQLGRRGRCGCCQGQRNHQRAGGEDDEDEDVEYDEDDEDEDIEYDEDEYEAYDDDHHHMDQSFVQQQGR